MAALSVHLLPFLGASRLDEIDRRLCERFKESKLREADELRTAIADGAVLQRVAAIVGDAARLARSATRTRR